MERQLLVGERGDECGGLGLVRPSVGDIGRRRPGVADQCHGGGEQHRVLEPTRCGERLPARSRISTKSIAKGAYGLFHGQSHALRAQRVVDVLERGSTRWSAASRRTQQMVHGGARRREAHPACRPRPVGAAHELGQRSPAGAPAARPRRARSRRAAARGAGRPAVTPGEAQRAALEPAPQRWRARWPQRHGRPRPKSSIASRSPTVADCSAIWRAARPAGPTSAAPRRARPPMRHPAEVPQHGLPQQRMAEMKAERARRAARSRARATRPARRAPHRRAARRPSRPAPIRTGRRLPPPHRACARVVREGGEPSERRGHRRRHSRHSPRPTRPVRSRGDPPLAPAAGM